MQMNHDWSLRSALLKTRIHLSTTDAGFNDDILQVKNVASATGFEWDLYQKLFQILIQKLDAM